MLLHLGAGYFHNDFKDTSPVTDYDVLGQLGIKGATRGPKDGARFPQFSTFAGNNSTGGMSQMGSGAQSRSIEIKPTFVASISWVKNNHTFKFGGEGRTEGYPTIGFTNNSGTIAFNAAQTANPWSTTPTFRIPVARPAPTLNQGGVERMGAGGRLLGDPVHALPGRALRGLDNLRTFSPER